MNNYDRKRRRETEVVVYMYNRACSVNSVCAWVKVKKREKGGERLGFFLQMYIEEGLTIVSLRASNCSIFHPQPNCHNSTTSRQAS